MCKQLILDQYYDVSDLEAPTLRFCCSRSCCERHRHLPAPSSFQSPPRKRAKREGTYKPFSKIMRASPKTVGDAKLHDSMHRRHSHYLFNDAYATSGNILHKNNNPKNKHRSNTIACDLNTKDKDDDTDTKRTHPGPSSRGG